MFLEKEEPINSGSDSDDDSDDSDDEDDENSDITYNQLIEMIRAKNSNIRKIKFIRNE